VSVNYTVIGRCSCCGGEVRALSGAWMSVTPPPPPTCASCGAQALGPVVQTTPVTRPALPALWLGASRTRAAIQASMDRHRREDERAEYVRLLEEERDEARAELAAAWEETGRPSGCNTLAGAVRWALRGKYNRAELSQILGRREGETTAEAARRVVAERDALQGRWCLACGGTGQGLGIDPCDACQGGAR